MTVNRKVPTSTTDPAGISGSSYADQVAEEVEALWRIAAEPLTSVDGTNTITASTLVSTLASYEAGSRFSLVPVATNTGAVTLNVDSLGAKAVKSNAGGALAGGELVSGTLYLLEYDGTDFRILTGDYDLGAGIDGLTAKTTPVDADTFVLSDSAASNAGKKITFANLKSAIPSSVLIGEDEPTSDVSSISRTGLSAYRDIEVVFGMQTNAAGGTAITVQARSSGGTWRDILLLDGGASVVTVIGEMKVSNFGRANDVKIVTAIVYMSTSQVIDRSSATIPAVDTTATSYAHMLTWDEQWDEIRFAPDGQNIEGSTADERAYVAWRGIGEGD